MQRGAKLWIALFLAVICIVAWYRYDQYVVQKNFLLEVNAVCNPASEACFVADCSPTDDPFCDTTPYKKVEILASEAPACLEEHTCESFSCDGIERCSITYCLDEIKEDWESCTEIVPAETPTTDIVSEAI
jgi:hypothetical protein